MDKFEKTVQRQLEAYNNHNIDDFIKYYALDSKGIDIDTNAIMFDERNSMIPLYTSLFENDELHCELVQRMVLNRTIIDYERITRDDSRITVDAIAIYDVNENGLIQNVRFTKGKK